MTKNSEPGLVIDDDLEVDVGRKYTEGEDFGKVDNVDNKFECLLVGPVVLKIILVMFCVDFNVDILEDTSNGNIDEFDVYLKIK